MSNLWEHPSIIAAEALAHMEDALIITNAAAVDKTSEFTYKPNGWKVGDVVSFRTHGEYSVDEFSSSISIQDISTSSRSMQIEKHLDISVEITAREEVLDLDSFSEQVIRPASYSLASYVDTYVGTKILQAAGLYVSGTTLFGTAADIALARKAAILQQLGMERYCIVDLDLEAVLLGQAWFNQAQTRGNPGISSLQSGVMGRVMGMDFGSSIAFPSTAFTAGDMVCQTNNTTGTTNLIGDDDLVVDNQTASKEVVVGDRLAIAGVRRPLVVKTAIADTSATTTVELVDPITEIIPDNAAVTVIGSGTSFDIQGAIFDNRSLAVGFPMLDSPEDKVVGVASNNGISIRVVKGYDMTSKKTTMSLDLLVGAFALDPRRITLVGG